MSNFEKAFKKIIEEEGRKEMEKGRQQGIKQGVKQGVKQTIKGFLMQNVKLRMVLIFRDPSARAGYARAYSG